MQLQNARVVVTGASQGIGREIARELARRGARVLGVARSVDKLTALSDEIGCEHLVADLTNADDLDSLVARSTALLGGIDVFVNNAGIETNTAFTETPRAEIRNLARLNFEAVLLLTRDVLPGMLDQGRGHIVQLSSVAGTIPFPGLTAYAGSKAGITNFTESLRLELARTPIGLTVVAPGPVDTPMWDRLDRDGPLYPAPALQRFRRLGFLPKLDPAQLAAKTVDAVADNKRFVRVPARYGAYHALNNAPRRLVEVAMTGVKLPMSWTNEVVVSQTNEVMAGSQSEIDLRAQRDETSTT